MHLKIEPIVDIDTLLSIALECMDLQSDHILLSEKLYIGDFVNFFLVEFNEGNIWWNQMVYFKFLNVPNRETHK